MSLRELITFAFTYDPSHDAPSHLKAAKMLNILRFVFA